MIKRKLMVLVLCLLIAAVAMCANDIELKSATKPFPRDGKVRMARTAWMREAKWGIAIHFIREFLDQKRQMTPKQWSELVDQVDVEALADQVAQTGAGLVLIGLSQCGGYFLAPNATYDRIMGRNEKTTWFPKRDLIRDLGKALKKRNIRLMVYMPIEPPIRGDAEAVRVFRPIGQKHPGDGHVISSDEGWRHFSGQWEKVVCEYSKTWGDLVSGWWFDGGWFGHLSYKDSPNWDSFMAAVRAGNKNSAIAINHQYRNLRGLLPPREDYFAGEVNHPDSIIVTSSFRHQCVQNQVLTFLGVSWGIGEQPRYNTEQLSRIADNVVKKGGVLIWDIPFNRNGTLKSEFIEPLKLFNAAVRNGSTSYRDWKKQTGGKMIPRGNLAYKKRALLINRSKKNQFQKILPPNDRIHFAKNGVDGDPKTKAMASNEWGWKYLIDLLKEEEFSRIKIRFSKDTYPTHFIVRVRSENSPWQQVLEKTDGNGSPVDLRFDKLEARFIEVEAVKPDGPNQKGSQMSIVELEVF